MSTELERPSDHAGSHHLDGQERLMMREDQNSIIKVSFLDVGEPGRYCPCNFHETEIDFLEHNVNLWLEGTINLNHKTPIFVMIFKFTPYYALIFHTNVFQNIQIIVK